MPCGSPAFISASKTFGMSAHRHMQFPAEFADIVDAQRPHAGDARDLDLLARQPAKGGVGKIGLGAWLSTSRALGPARTSTP